MRRLLILLVSVVGFSAIGAGLNQNVPVQSYEQAGTPAKSQPTKSSASKQAQQAAAPSQTTPASSNNNGTEVRALQAEITQVNQNSLQYQQKNDGKIRMLTNQLSTLSSRVDRIQKAMILLDQEINAMQNKSTAVQELVKNPQTNEHGKHWLDYWEGHFGVWSVLLFMLVILVVLAFMSRLVIKANKKQQASSEDKDTDDEYDYLGSEEGMPAKLNLARAYIKMEDFESAKEVLDEVLSDGTDEQKAQAQELKKQCQ